MKLHRLSAIHIAFNPQDSRATSVLEFFRRCASPRARNSNPDCELRYTILEEWRRPSLEVTYADGSVESINTSNQTAQQLESRVNSTVMRQEVNSVLREAGYTEGVFLRDVLLDSPYYPSEKSRMYLYGLDGADEPAAPPRPEPTNHSGSS